MTHEEFEIYPTRGEIWALYKDWNLDDWTHGPCFAKQCKFELVEIMSDFSKSLGADAACSVKVDGYRSIFERQKIGGNPVTCHIPTENLYLWHCRKLLALGTKCFTSQADKLIPG